MNAFTASALIEKHAGAGEDARPIAMSDNGWMLAAVFDGMGGSGARRYTRRSDGREATGAAFASETAADAVRRAFASFARSDASAEAFDAQAMSAIKAAIGALPQELDTTSRVSGSLMLDFPTTACMVLLQQSEAKGAALWVGDSLAFSWSGSAGLKLLSWAGRNAPEAFAALVRSDGNWADAPNPGAISSDVRRPWAFSVTPLDLANADLVFTASDGAYTAFGGPAGLEAALVNAIANAASLDAASANLAKAMDAVKQDDVSFALLCPSGDWERVKAASAHRTPVALDANFFYPTAGRAPVFERPPTVAPRTPIPPIEPPKRRGSSGLLIIAGLAVAAIAVALWFGYSANKRPQRLAHGQALCDLTAANFDGLLGANPTKHLTASNACAVTSSTGASVDVVANSHAGATQATLNSNRIRGHAFVDASDLGEGAFIDVTNAASPKAPKITVFAVKNGHLVTIEIVSPNAMGDTEIAQAHDHARAFVAAL